MLRAGYVTYAHVIPNLYVLRGGLRSAGGMIAWLAKCLSNSTIDDPNLPYNQLMVEATDGIGQRAGPLWLPHLLGSGTPYDDEKSLAAVLGLRPEHNRGDLFRGLFESLAFWLRQNLEEVETLIDHPISKILLLGGTTRLDLLTQLKADVLNRPVMVPQIREPSATGAALLAGVGAGYFSNLEDGISHLMLENKVIHPDPDRVKWYSALYEVGYQPLYTTLRQINHDLVDLPGKLKSEKIANRIDHDNSIRAVI